MSLRYARFIHTSSRLQRLNFTRTMNRPRAAVPTTREVVAGAGVNIVLKQDQPTGRTVSGTVRDVLTRGNHPRGIKVRLADGRVGRVQSIASGEVKPAGEDIGEAAGFQTAPGEAAWATDDSLGRRRRQDRGRRTDEEDVPPQQIGLDAFIKPAKQKGKRRGNTTRDVEGKDAGEAQRAVADEAPEDTGTSPELGERHQEGVARCPVCNSFEGDEAAVAHHVASHFDA